MIWASYYPLAGNPFGSAQQCTILRMSQAYVTSAQALSALPRVPLKDLQSHFLKVTARIPLPLTPCSDILPEQRNRRDAHYTQYSPAALKPLWLG